MRGNGNKTNVTAGDSNYLLTEILIREPTTKVNHKEEVFILGLMGKFTTVSGKKALNMVMEFGRGLLAIHT